MSSSQLPHPTLTVLSSDNENESDIRFRIHIPEGMSRENFRRLISHVLTSYYPRWTKKNISDKRISKEEREGMLVNDLLGAEHTCSICLDGITKNAMRLSCMHTFHPQCIDPWLDVNLTCPNCRAPVRS